ncbi:hypothetical protein GYH30_016206 [Glycine max]|uniref:Uncharacterized protein n=1 Tax=Glycine max TaxID=3847 RepID=A0A0R0JRP6_SOYBN|nr:hypothetical protein GYH30_016206 [Glycine max]
MEITKVSSILIVVLLFVSCISQANAYYYQQCSTKGTRCYEKYVRWPTECPSNESTDPKAKVSQIDCDKSICRAVCRSRKPNCNAPGSGCYDPCFIECSTSTKSNEHFTLVSDFAIQINARFIGYRPEGSGRDYTWIQALGILFNSKTLSLEAVKTPQWSENVDHLKFTYNDNPNGV